MAAQYETNPMDSVVLITSNDPQNSKFGTGFIIYQDEGVSYLLTCEHVVRDIGGPEQVKADNYLAKVLPFDPEDVIDLVVLQVEGLLDKPPLSLSNCGKKGNDIEVVGCYAFDRKHGSRPLEGKLGKQTMLLGTNKVKTWDLKIEDDFNLKPGYSGSPVIDKNSGYVLGIVSHRLGQGEKGVAISVEALQQVWPDMPSDLINSIWTKEHSSVRYEKHKPYNSLQPQISDYQTPFLPNNTWQLSFTDKSSLVEALLACPTMYDRHRRNLVVRELPPQIANNISRNEAAKAEVMSIVSTCINHQGGLETLLTIVQFYEGDSIPMQNLVDLAKQIIPDYRV